MATNGKLYVRISAAAALKALGDKVRGVKVQVVTKYTEKDKDGKEIPKQKIEDKSLAADLVLSAKKWANGAVSITTIDGRRYPESVDTSPEVDEEEEVAVK